MPTVLCLNNYDIGWFAQDQPSSPKHFLYGVDHLHRRGLRVVVCGEKTTRLLRWIQSVAENAHLPIPLGDLCRQWNALDELRSADLIYSPCDSVAWVFCHLRAAGLISAPVICLAHHPLLRGRARALRRPWIRLALRGVDAFPSLSTAVADEINALSPGQAKSQPLPWGPDLEFYPPYQRPGRGVVSAGRTGRDFATLGKAAGSVNGPVTIICPASYVTPAFKDFGPNLSILSNQNPMYFTYRQLIQFFSDASAIAIPMVPQLGLCGLTSLLDALAMGRAVIMTKNPLIDIDIESEGIGFWVAPGDIEGWRRALRFVQDHPAEVEEMGRRARLLAEERYNSQVFADRLYDIVAQCLKESVPGANPVIPGGRGRDSTTRMLVSSHRTS